MATPLPNFNNNNAPYQAVHIVLQNHITATGRTGDFLYNQLVLHEGWLQNTQARWARIALVKCRAVGWLIIHSPAIRTTIIDRIGDLENNQHFNLNGAQQVINNAVNLFNLPQLQVQLVPFCDMVFRNLIVFWRSTKARPVPLPGNLVANGIIQNPNIGPSPPLNAATRRAILVRDGHVCSATGQLDTAELRQNPNNGVILQNTGILQIAHILPRKLQTNCRDIWATLQTFGCLSAADIQGFQQYGMNHASNLFSLSSDRHGQFDRMVIWFERGAPLIPNDYNVYFGPTWNNNNVQPVPANLTPPVNYQGNLAVPSELLLSLHAAASKAHWLSGAADVFLAAEFDPDDADLAAQSDDLLNGASEADMAKLEELILAAISKQAATGVSGGAKTEGTPIPGQDLNPKPKPTAPVADVSDAKDKTTKILTPGSEQQKPAGATGSEDKKKIPPAPESKEQPTSKPAGTPGVSVSAAKDKTKILNPVSEQQKPAGTSGSEDKKKILPASESKQQPTSKPAGTPGASVPAAEDKTKILNPGSEQQKPAGASGSEDKNKIPTSDPKQQPSVGTRIDAGARVKAGDVRKQGSSTASGTLHVPVK